MPLLCIVCLDRCPNAYDLIWLKNGKIVFVNSFIDYIYYRISRLYYKYDKGAGVYAMLIISLTEGLLSLEIFLLLSRLLFSAYQLQSLKSVGMVIVFVLMLPFLVINYLKYVKPAGKYDRLDNHWKSESSTKRIFKGLSIVLLLLTPWLLLFPLNSYLQHLIK